MDSPLNLFHNRFCIAASICEFSNESFEKVRRFSYSDANGVASSCSPKNDSRPQAQNRAGRQTAILRLLKPGS